MAQSSLLYYISDRAAFLGDERSRRIHLLDKIEEAACCGVDFIQLREKDLPIRELELLAREAVRIIRDTSRLRTEKREPKTPRKTALLINSRTDVALVTAANGVHLPAGDISPGEVRKAWDRRAGGGKVRNSREDLCGADSPFETPLQEPLIVASCHSVEEVVQAAADHADFAVFAPVFEKKDVPGVTPTGLETLRRACRANIPVLALGGVTLRNAKLCIEAGASGIAGIRLFQENDIATVVHQLRGN
jgi:thiamine-phosphate pyrophosphorylase